MDTTPRPIPDVPAPAGGARDFVAVDDSGAFSYHESELKLIAAFEYVGEASCIIDRGGNSYDLAHRQGGPHEQLRPAPLWPDPEAHGLGPRTGFLGRRLTV